MTAHLIFSSRSLENPLEMVHNLEQLQFLFADRLEERDYDTLLVTTTRSLDSNRRHWWTVAVDHELPEDFYKDLIRGVGDAQGGTLNIYEEDDGYLYASYTLGHAMSIWKFHFIHDIENVIEDTIKHIGSDYYEDFRDTLEYALQDAEYIEYNEELACMMVEEGLEAKVFLALPYMQEVVIYGTLVYDNNLAAWMIEKDTLEYAQALDTYIEECLY